MGKKNYTIANENVEADYIRRIYEYAKKLYSAYNLKDLDIILEVALKDRERFPGMSSSVADTPEKYIDNWVKGYWEASSNIPSKRIANPKTACNDPALGVIVKYTQGMNDDDARKGLECHNLYMSAENIQGNLLEEYIAKNIRPYGFVWCNGNVLQATDFCNSDGSVLLQIKNKSNTENSSSSGVREGTRIEKWYRLGTKIVNKKMVPDYKWSNLNKIINDNCTMGKTLPPCNMSEDKYIEFLKTVAVNNSSLINNM